MVAKRAASEASSKLASASLSPFYPSSWQLLHRPSRVLWPERKKKKWPGVGRKGKRKPFHCAKWLFMMLLLAGSYQLPRLRLRLRPRDSVLGPGAGPEPGLDQNQDRKSTLGVAPKCC